MRWLPSGDISVKYHLQSIQIFKANHDTQEFSYPLLDKHFLNMPEEISRADYHFITR